MDAAKEAFLSDPHHFRCPNREYQLPKPFFYSLTQLLACGKQASPSVFSAVFHFHQQGVRIL